MDVAPDDTVAVPVAGVPLVVAGDVEVDGELLVVDVVTGVVVIGAGLLDDVLVVVLLVVLLGVVLPLAAEAPVKSTMKVSMRVVHPKAVSGPSFPSQ